MSCRRRGTRLEDKGTIPVDFSLKQRFADRFFDYIDRAAEDDRELTVKVFQSGEVVEAAGGKTIAQFHRHIDIGIRPGVTTCDGAEHGRADNSDRS